MNVRWIGVAALIWAAKARHRPLCFAAYFRVADIHDKSVSGERGQKLS